MHSSFFCWVTEWPMTRHCRSGSRAPSSRPKGMPCCARKIKGFPYWYLLDAPGTQKHTSLAPVPLTPPSPFSILDLESFYALMEVLMHSFTSIFLSALLIVGLIPVPAMAAPATASMGVVLHADRAKVGNSQAVSGATVFDGDRLETDPAGQLRVRIGTSQAHLFPRSSAIVR